MDSLNDDKINRHSSDLEVESEEKQSGKEIEVDEDRLPSRAMAIHEHIRQDGEKEDGTRCDGFALVSHCRRTFYGGITPGERNFPRAA